MDDVVIVDQEYASAMVSLCRTLAALRRICYEHANILQGVANYEGFQSAEFSLSIDTYGPQIMEIGNSAMGIAEKVLEQTSSFVQDVDDADRFLY